MYKKIVKEIDLNVPKIISFANKIKNHKLLIIFSNFKQIINF